MLLTLNRYQPDGDAIFGQLQAVNTPEAFEPMDTLENLQYAIPTGFYRLRLTHSPRFQELLPILDGVYGYARDPHNGAQRTGIRIHAGNTIQDTTGCILVGEKSPYLLSLNGEGEQRLLSSRRRLNELVTFLLNYKRLEPYEDIYLEITEPDPYLDADIPYPSELQEP